MVFVTKERGRTSVFLTKGSAPFEFLERECSRFLKIGCFDVSEMLCFYPTVPN